ncbi:MAG: NupC/NupG family nucleoside CNT transporter [Gemmatimonadota bacterium]
MTVAVPLLGMVALLTAAVVLSADRQAIRLRTVGGALALQAGVGALALYVPAGRRILRTLSAGVQTVMDSALAGIAFLFGGLVGPAAEEGGLGFIFAFEVLPLIIFFSSLIAVLYHWGVMPWLIRIIGGGLQRLLGTSRTESLSATANIFVGLTEAPLAVRPFVAGMTTSELFAVMVGGLASVAGSTLAGYAALGVELDYLLAAAFMAAPGGLLMAKILQPETGTIPDDGREETAVPEDVPMEAPVNVVDAAATGASQGLVLAANVGAMLLAFIALIALANVLLGTVGGWAGLDALTFEAILGWLFAPVAFLVGVPWEEAAVAGGLLGQKLVLNEFVAFVNLVGATEPLSDRARAITTFGLCGFANFASIAILLGGLGGMAPSRRGDIARLGIRAVVAASLANLMSAAIAGFFLGLS